MYIGVATREDDTGTGPAESLMGKMMKLCQTLPRASSKSGSALQEGNFLFLGGRDFNVPFFIFTLSLSIFFRGSAARRPHQHPSPHRLRDREKV